MQTKKQSLIEACMNVVIGFTIAVLTQIAIFPLFDIHIPLQTDLAIGAIFTVVSLVRSYAIRRYYNWKQG